jgi:asparagine synthase (glutamine-hydrolysing)
MHRRGLRARTLTFGLPRDHEIVGASAVATSLGWPHAVVQDQENDIEDSVFRHVRHEQLTNGMSNVYTWGLLPQLSSVGDRILSGYWLELFVGGAGRELPGSPGDTNPMERVVGAATSYGLAPEQLRRLLPTDLFGKAVEESLDRIRASYASLPADPARRAWYFTLQHRDRFHAGSTPWRMSLARWPVMLVLDRELVKLCASLPMSTLVNRRVEDALLCTRFPDLARLPLDRGSEDTQPLLTSAWWRFRRFAQGLSFSRHERREHPGERRRYHRLFDINAPRWRAMRRIAEPGRRRAAEVLHPVALDALLPGPDADVEPRYPVAGSNGLKSLVGFLVWSMEHG